MPFYFPIARCLLMVISMYACVPLCHPSIFPLLISLFSHQSSHHLPETLLSSKAFPDFSIKFLRAV
uniref:Secreted protein n=1 Tax=Solanum lycopersicum TaxID=4081 RepID=A0A3Q7GGX4_SOLLC